MSERIHLQILKRNETSKYQVEVNTMLLHSIECIIILTI